jgi:hypothetical protein
LEGPVQVTHRTQLARARHRDCLQLPYLFAENGSCSQDPAVRDVGVKSVVLIVGNVSLLNFFFASQDALSLYSRK